MYVPQMSPASHTGPKSPPAGLVGARVAGMPGLGVMRKSKVDAVRDALSADIIGRRLPFGAKLPSESALCTRFGVSRVTVRAAINALREAGLLVSQQGAGHFVRRFRIPIELDRHRTVGEIFQPYGVVVTAELLSLETMRATPEDAAVLAVPTMTSVVYMRRLRAVQGRAVCLEMRLIRADIGLALFDIELGDRDLCSVYEGHFKIALSCTRICVDHVPASAEDAALLALPVGAPLLRTDTLIRDRDGRPLDRCRRLFSAEDIEFWSRSGRW